MPRPQSAHERSEPAGRIFLLARGQAAAVAQGVAAILTVAACAALTVWAVINIRYVLKE
jgi:hypothetical protein